MRGRPKAQIVRDFYDLPSPITNQVSTAGIKEREAEAHMDSLLNAIHIRTKERFYTREGLEKMKWVAYTALTLTLLE